MSVKRGKVLCFKHLDVALATWLVCGVVWVLSVGGSIAIG